MAAKKPDILVEDGTVYALRAGTSIFVKTAVLCAMTGKSNQWIGQLVSQGTLSKRSTPHGSLFDLTSTIRAYCDMLENRVKANEQKGEDELDTARRNADVSIKKAKAVVATLEANELRGKMHRSEDVSAMTEDLIFAIRGMLLALPGRLAVDVAAAKTPAEAAEQIRNEVHAVMEELSNYRYDAKKYEERVRERQRWDSDGGDDDD